jgi:hypothetical protein
MLFCVTSLLSLTSTVAIDDDDDDDDDDMMFQHVFKGCTWKKSFLNIPVKL